MAKVPRTLCIYHKNCLDGRGAAAVVARRESDCEFVPLQYGMTRPPVAGRQVYIVDFGLPAEQMRAIRAEADEVQWIDHHASQLPVRAALGWGVLDTSECGASLTWKTLFPNEPPPPVIAYIKDKDLWRWELPDSRAIAAGLEQKFKGDAFAGLLDADLDEMARLGRPALEATALRIAEAVKTGIPIDDAYGIKGVRALAVNCNKDLNDIGEHICLPHDAGGLGFDLAIIYYKKKAATWVHSLRSAAVDCSKIAVARGGGGHPQSACYMAKIAFTESPDFLRKA
jgi:uncharacterized protein